MKKLGELVAAYTGLLQNGELQAAYRGILSVVGRLRARFEEEFPAYDVGCVYQGYMDMSYFPIIPPGFKELGLKIAVVYLHEKGRFEVWLSGKNRRVTGEMREKLAGADFGELKVFHDPENPDAALQCLLTDCPDLDDELALASAVIFKTEEFTAAVKRSLE